ncbi:hypothetical protein GCM10027613_45400 [Microlunatus endophyticus]
MTNQHPEPPAYPSNPGGRERWQQAYQRAVAEGRIRDADFATLSGLEVDPVYGPPEDTDPPMDRIGWPGNSRSPGGCIPPAIAGARGRSASSPDSATPGRPTNATR